HIDYTGNELEDEETLIREIRAKDNYTDILPGIHLRYAATENLILRAAWTHTLARPNYFDLIPYRIILREDEEILTGNSELNPLKALNLDLQAEQYLQSVGLVSAGVFYKKVKNFIYTSVNNEYSHPEYTNGEEWT